MTGFGRFEDTIDGYHVIVEIKSVNHKFFELNSRLTRGFSFLEDKLKSYLQSRVSRGKLDMYVHIENLEDKDVEVLVNHSLASGYVNAFHEIAERYDLKGDITIDSVVKFNDIFTIHKAPSDEDKIWEIVKTVAEKAVDNFVAMRENEGARLYNDIMSRAKTIMELVEKVEIRSPQTVNEYRQKLENKIREVLEDRNIDESRLLTEVAIFSDKVAVAEETVRLKSHFNQLETFAQTNQAIGRKMDFLVQEMNREANTIGSKASDSEIAYMVVEIKSEIEKIREQVQNIE